MQILRIPLIGILFFLFSISVNFAQDSSTVYKAKTLSELESSIQRVLTKTNTAGAGVVLVSGNETIFLKGFGKADIKNNIDVNENTMFRLGSVSKVYVALAILKLQEEGRINLKDKVCDLIPEVEINNPWKDEYPIRVEHLLEHSTGWSYWHFAELGSDDPKPKTLKEALDYCPKSRISTFVPGTRILESNVGSATAAYLVEKISGLSFEDYVDKYLFEPMGMESMTYLESDQYKKTGAKLYDNGIELNYFNILYRPAAALNGSPKDMARMVKFFINRGELNDNRILSDASLQRMERSESMGDLSKSKLFKGHGLSNDARNFKNFVYKGYSGSLPGGNANFGYLPKYKLGYGIMINDGNEEAVSTIAYLIKHYQTQNLTQEPVKADNSNYEIVDFPAGYYTIINAKIDKIGFIERIKNIQKVWVKNDTLFSKSILKGNTSRKYLPVGNNEFRLVGSDEISLALINDPLDGEILVSYDFFKQISSLWAYTLLFIFWSFYLVLISTIFFGLLRVLIYLFGKKKNKIALKVCLWPLITNSFIFIIIFSIMIKVQTRYDMFQVFGTMNLISVLILICSIAYAFASIWSVFYILNKFRVKMSKFFYLHSALAAILNLIIMLYFLANGLIGIPTWL